MQENFLKLYVKGKILIDVIKEEHGQDLVEYAAVISVVVLGLIAGMGTLANGINTAMVSVSTKITNKLS
jgi:Flp pilus assembly pilin Flp